ncbi:MipA/OmpV family protein [Salinivibrio proteolyticus]|uniref:MipA/OmpV family protein n=1 Tax=Salinivibrio TaxID=51366 RepID=UPI0039EFC685
MMKKLAIIIAAIASSAAYAGDTYIRNGNIYSHEGQAVASIGVGVTSDLYKDQDKNIYPQFNLGYNGENFNADLSNGLNYRFLGNNDDTVNLNAYIGHLTPGYKSKDADILKGMKDRDPAIDGGINMDINTGKGGVLSTYVGHDITGEYDGFNAGMKYMHLTHFGNVDFVPYAGVDWLSKDHVDHYFGVKDSEATAQRAAYKGDDAFAYNVGYKLVVPMGENWDISQTTQYTRLGSDIADSPIVDSANQWAAQAMVSYHF